VLIVDDEKAVADTLVMILRKKGYDAVAAYDSDEALEEMNEFLPDCVIADVIMPGMKGTDLCAIIERRVPGCHILLFSGDTSTRQLIESARSEGRKWEMVSNPADPGELLDQLATLRAGHRDVPSG